MRARLTLTTLMVLLVAMLSLFWGLGAIHAQESTNPTCEAFIQTAYEQLNTACVGLPGSSACYGSSASFTPTDGNGESSFSQAGDQLDLSSIQSISTLPLDSDAEQWGLALLNVQANVPLALSEQGLKYLLIGDVEVENAVDPATAFTPGQPVLVTAIVAANLRSAPSTDAQVIASAPPGTELWADGLSGDANWLRVMNGEQVAWISRQVVSAADGSFNDMPTWNASARTLMQSIYLHTGAETSDCTDAPPSMLVVQAPGGVNASITVNGVEVRFDGTIAMHVTPDHVLHLFVLSGGANMGGLSIPPGFTLNVPLSEDERQAAGQATGLRPIQNEERQYLTLVANGVSDDLLYTALTVPTQEETGAILAGLNSASAGQTTVGPASGEADCSRFKPTSPLDGLAFGISTFYWDGAPGATGYRLNFFADGNLRFSVDTPSFSTTFQVDTGSPLGDGSNFSWNVEALVNGQVACTSGMVSIPRSVNTQFAGQGGSGEAPQNQEEEPPWEGG
jgi:hypothetical protein